MTSDFENPLLKNAPECSDLSSETYQRLFTFSQAMICVLNADGKIILANDASWKMLKFNSVDDLLNTPCINLVHPDYRGVIECGFDILTAETSVLPLKFVCSDDQILDVEVMFSPLGDDQYMLEARDITERKRTAENLKDREQRLRGILDTVADAIITINERGEILSFNKAAEEIFGYTIREVLKQNISILIPEQHAKNHDQYLSNYLKTGIKNIIGNVNREESGIRKDGTEFPMELAVTELRHGSKRFYTGIVRDITKRKEAEEALRRAHEELEMRVEERTRELTQEISERHRAEDGLRLSGEVIESLAEGVAIINQDFRITSINPAFSDISGYTPKDLLGHKPINHAALSEDGPLFKDMWEGLQTRDSWEGEFWNETKDGEKYAERLSVTTISNPDDYVRQFAAIISDITKRKQDEERILFQANYDNLTQLPNRTLFHDRLDQAIVSMKRAKKSMGLLFIDLDGFKLVNDTLGHDIGDLLLQQASNRLSECVRDGDTVARLGGDEFTIIMPNLEDHHNAPLLAQRVLDTLSEPFHLNGHETFVSGSIGITIFPDDSESSAGLLKNADAAMYRAKEQGKANYQFFTKDMNQEVQDRLVVKTGLSKALDAHEFKLLYQPKLDLNTNRIIGAEALMRWESPDLGLVSPVTFIPILEETGMVIEVGAWAIRQACEQHVKWCAEGLPPVKIAVNLSARQMRDPSFVAIVKDALKEHNLPPSAMEIEITESMLMSDVPNVVAALEELHDYGINISMDDFGTGYSSLSYLKRFPIDTIKIDRSFVNDIHTSKDDAEIIHTIINMGQTLNRKIIAEGVETIEQLDILKNFNCDEIQGYYFSRPLEPETFATFLADFEKSHTS